jgi:hypothetical protein
MGTVLPSLAEIWKETVWLNVGIAIVPDVLGGVDSVMLRACTSVPDRVRFHVTEKVPRVVWNPASMVVRLPGWGATVQFKPAGPVTWIPAT